MPRAPRHVVVVPGRVPRVPRVPRRAAGTGPDAPLTVWEGGGSGVVAPVEPSEMERLEKRWAACEWDLEPRWEIAKELWAIERARVGLTDEWKVSAVSRPKHVAYEVLRAGSHLVDGKLNDPHTHAAAHERAPNATFPP